MLPNGAPTGALAVAPELNLYVAALDVTNHARPFYNHAIDALATDAQGNLYVGSFLLGGPNTNATEVRVYDAGASTTPGVLRKLLNAAPGRITWLAIFQ